jgi:hypothetical protein
MKIACLLVFVLMVLSGCAPASEEAPTKEEIEQPRELAEKDNKEHEEKEPVEKGVPAGFPVYPGAEYNRQYKYGDVIRYIYQTDASARELYTFYLEALQGDDVVIDSVCKDDYGWADMVVYKNDAVQVIIRIGSYPDFGMEIHKDIYGNWLP